tara:strand:+ start:702 stop:1220 length:519 start_codon:yes stop_codon:yes gene_type:complete
MEYPKNSIYQHFALTLVILSLFGCTSIAIESKKNSNEVPNINENFKIEGKFKLSFMDSKETGYFELDKYNNTISLTLGKNYLLPEEVIILDIRENLDFNQFALNQDYLNEIPSISIKYLLELCLGLRAFNDQNKDLKVDFEFEELSRTPSKVIISNNKNIELTILIKAIWKS